MGGIADQGQVFVFSGADGSLLYTQTDPSPSGSGHSGFSIAALGLLDGDAIPDVAVGIHVKNVGGNSAQGQVSIFSGADGSLLLTLDHPDPMGHASFGGSIAKLGVVNGATLFAVGAEIQDVGGNVDQGQAYVFSISLDSDSDGISDANDNCPTLYNAGQDDADFDGEGDICDDCTDIDSDGFGNPGFPDNTCAPDDCPETVNPSQSDVDSDGAGDLCDVCPADPADECDPSGSTAEEIAANEGGTVETPDGELTVDIDSDDLAEDTTISVTQTIPQDPEVDLMLGPISGLGQAVSVYDLEPDGQVFDAPVTLTIITDVSDLKPVFFDKLSLYLWTDTDSDGMEDTFVAIDGATCSVANEPVDCDPKRDPPTVCVSTATCTADVDHFSVFALVAPLDSDDDGIPDLFGGIEDICPDDPNVIEGFLPPMTDLVPKGEVAILPDKAFKSNRTLPMKFDYSCGTVLVTDQDAVTKPELLGVYWVGNADPLPIVDPDSGESNDSGVWFRYSDEHWIYNFSTSGLPGGTYEVHVRMPDGRILKGGFVLR